MQLPELHCLWHVLLQSKKQTAAHTPAALQLPALLNVLCAAVFPHIRGQKGKYNSVFVIVDELRS